MADKSTKEPNLDQANKATTLNKASTTPSSSTTNKKNNTTSNVKGTKTKKKAKKKQVSQTKQFQGRNKSGRSSDTHVLEMHRRFRNLAALVQQNRLDRNREMEEILNKYDAKDISILSMIGEIHMDFISSQQTHACRLAEGVKQAWEDMNCEETQQRKQQVEKDFKDTIANLERERRLYSRQKTCLTHELGERVVTTEEQEQRITRALGHKSSSRGKIDFTDIEIKRMITPLLKLPPAQKGKTGPLTKPIQELVAKWKATHNISNPSVRRWLKRAVENKTLSQGGPGGQPIVSAEEIAAVVLTEIQQRQLQGNMVRERELPALVLAAAATTAEQRGNSVRVPRTTTLSTICQAVRMLTVQDSKSETQVVTKARNAAKNDLASRLSNFTITQGALNGPRAGVTNAIAKANPIRSSYYMCMDGCGLTIRSDGGIGMSKTFALLELANDKRQANNTESSFPTRVQWYSRHYGDGWDGTYLLLLRCFISLF